MRSKLVYNILSRCKIDTGKDDINKLIFNDKDIKFKINNKYDFHVKKWDVDRIKGNITFNTNRILLKKGDMVTFNIIANYGFYSTNAKIEEYYITKKNVKVEFKILDPFKKVEKRKFYRLEENLNLIIAQANRPEYSFKASTVNISVGGVSMNSKKLITDEKDLNINIDLNGTQLNVKGDVLKSPKVNQGGEYNYRVKFTYVDEDTEQILYNYILDKQQQKISNKK